MSTPRPLISAYVVISLALTLALDGASSLATEVVMRTSMGHIRIRLFDDESPITSANFLQYVDEGFFDGDDGLGQTIFHRVIPGFVIQGGGHLADLTEKVTHDPIVNESNNGLSNLRGTLAMARTSDPDSATSQFFINLVNNTFLDYSSPMSPGYAVFGVVVEGMAVVDAIAGVETETQGKYEDVPVVPIPVTDAERVMTYVDVNATGPTHDGLSWCTAYTDLQEALALASASAGIINEIRVADGTYTPATCETPPCSFTSVSPEREATFQLANGVTLAGGYAGCNDGGDVRNIGLYQTVLSGDLNGDDSPVSCTDDSPECDSYGGRCIGGSCIISENSDENSYHVATGSGTDQTAVLDGFTVTAGNASVSGAYDDYGAGIYIEGGSPTVRNCAFRGNQALYGSGGVWVYSNSSPTFTSCRFTGNTTPHEGGAFSAILNCHPTLTNCLFAANSADDGGGAMDIEDQSTVTLTNCTLVGNTALNGSGGAIWIESGCDATLVNCILWGNSDGGGVDESAQIHGGTPVVGYSCIQGCATFCDNPADANIGADPQFVDADGPDDIPGNEDDNLRLTSPVSPCIDAGNNDAVPPDVADLDDDGNTVERTPIELDGLARFADDPLVTDTGNGTSPIVDMGAYEFGCGNGTCGDFEDQCNCPQDCGTPPANEIAHGTCTDGIDNDCDGPSDCDDDDCRYDTDCFGCAPVLPIEDPPHNARKNRYISFNPNNSDNECALQIQLVSMRRCSGELSRACTVDDDCEAAVPGSGTCVEHPAVATAGPWWAQAPQQEQLGCLPAPCGDEDWFARVDASVHFQTWTLSTLHIGDCEMVPVATYEVRACLPPDGTECNLPLTVGTIEQPFIAPGFRGNYGDVAGPVDAITLEFTPPDGFTNVVDVSAYVLTKQNYGTANKPQTHPTWVDLHGLGPGNPPQYIINVSDLQQIEKAFAGDAWADDPGNMKPGQCP